MTDPYNSNPFRGEETVEFELPEEEVTQRIRKALLYGTSHPEMWADDPLGALDRDE